MAFGSIAARVVVALLLVAVAVSALPSGNVVKLSSGGYFKLDSLTGYSAISGNSAWTVSAWIYAPSSSADFAILTFGPNGACNGEAGMGVYSWVATKGLTILACNYDGSQGSTLLTGAWHHLAISHSTSGSKAYVDGVLEWSSTVSLVTNPVIGLIGARSADSSPKALGSFWLDDLRVWSRSLSQSDVRFDMHGGAMTTSLVGNYDGSTNTAGKLVDIANANNGVNKGTAAIYTTTARCPTSTYIASCGMLSCRYLLSDSSIPMCGPCTRGYSSAVFANLTGYCDLDLPNVPTYPTAAASATSGCIDVSAQWPVISAAITSFTFTRLDNSAQVVGSAGVATSTTTATICGLTGGVSYSVMINATNAAGTGPGVVVSATASGCSAGSYASGSSCIGCAAGTFSVAGATSCTPCDAGQYAAKGSSACTDCAAGYYSTAAGASACSACAAGTAAYATGSTTCMTCWAGYYSASSASAACTDCNFNEYALAGDTTCTACAAGTWTTDTGSSYCTGCSAGTYQKTSSSGTTTCLSCAAGSYAAAGATVCTTCAVGTYSSSAGASACTTCAPGTRVTSTGATSCVECNAGTYGPAHAGGAYCILCPSGRFAPSSGYSVCTQCAVGMYQCSKAATTCDVCAAGKYASIVGRSECTSCPTGRFAASTSSTTCSYCSAGSYAECTGKSVCTSCAAGTFSSARASVCSNCAAGKYASQTASSVCTSCSAGSYSASVLSTSCTPCATGSYASASGSTTCAACIKSSAQTAGASTCTGTSAMLQHN